MRYLVAVVVFLSCATTPKAPTFEVEWAGDSRTAAPLWVCGEVTPGKLTCIDVPAFVEALQRRQVEKDAAEPTVDPTVSDL